MQVQGQLTLALNLLCPHQQQSTKPWPTIHYGSKIRDCLRRAYVLTMHHQVPDPYSILRIIADTMLGLLEAVSAGREASRGSGLSNLQHSQDAGLVRALQNS